MSLKHLPQLAMAVFFLIINPGLFAEGVEGVTGVWSTSPLCSK